MTTTEIKTRLTREARAKGPLGRARWTNGIVTAIAEPVHSHSSCRMTYAVRWYLRGSKTTEAAVASILAGC